MKLWLLIVAVIVCITSELANQPVIAASLDTKVSTQQPNKLDLLLIAPKRKYKRNDQLKIFALLMNSGKDDLYVLGVLDWGYSSSLLLQIRDASGKEVTPLGIPDDLPNVSAKDRSSFVKLLPSHFLGTDFFAPLDVLNLNRPGKYSIFVEYQSLFASKEVELSPFWGKENGTIRSNVVVVEVVR